MLIASRNRLARLHYGPNGFRVLSPGDHVLTANGQTVPVGSPTQLADIPYVFHTLSAYDPTGCAGDLKQAWAMTYSPSP